MNARHVLVLLGVASVAAMLPGVAQAATAGDHVVAVVVDFADGVRPTVIGCVKEPPGATDAQALADVIHARGIAQSRYASSGLLCGIGGVPSSGCGTQTNSGYQYWAYFHGTSAGWAYANDGPAERTAASATTAGFRFELTGKGNPMDPAPSTSPNPTALCAGAALITSSSSAERKPNATASASTSYVPFVVAAGVIIVIVVGVVVFRRRAS